MDDFGGKRWRPYLDQEAQKIRDQKIDHLKREYDGPSDFVRQKLKEEKVLNVEEQIKQKETQLETVEEELERLKQIKEQREKQSVLRDKKELLKKKQEQLKQAASSNTREELRQKVEKQILETKPPRFSDEEYLEKKSSSVEARVEAELDRQPDVDELVSDVERLQKDVMDLNGGQELDFFMDLSQKNMEVTT